MPFTERKSSETRRARPSFISTKSCTQEARPHNLPCPALGIAPCATAPCVLRLRVRWGCGRGLSAVSCVALAFGRSQAVGCEPHPLCRAPVPPSALPAPQGKWRLQPPVLPPCHCEDAMNRACETQTHPQGSNPITILQWFQGGRFVMGSRQRKGSCNKRGPVYAP